MKLRSYVFLLALAVSAVLLAVLGGVLPERLLPYLTEQFATELKQEALLIRVTLESSIHTDSEMHDYASRVGSLLGRRVTLIGPDGTVIGDNSADSARMENHNARPEIRQARTGGFGRSLRYSDTLRTEMLYVAVPFQTPGGATGVVRISLPYQVVGQAKTDLRRTLYWLSALVFLVAAGVAYLASHTISRSAGIMAETANRVSAGKLEARAPIRGPLELRLLGQAFNLMTEQLVAQIRANVSEREKLRTILEGMQEGVLLLNPRGEIEFINPAGCELLDLRATAEGRRMMELVRQMELEEALQAAISSRQAQKLEIELHRSGRNVLVSLYPVVHREEVRDLVAVFQDVSELRRLENMRKEFVANVSHELRTPLTSIRGYAETLLETPDLDLQTRQQFLSVMHRHAVRLSRLIDDLLQLSSLESEGRRLEKTSVNIADTAQSVLQAMRPQFEDKHIECSMQADSTLQILAGPRALEQVFYNLLDNAARYTPAGGKVSIEIRPDGNDACITIRDTGIGIPAEDLSRVFERFYRVDKSRSRDLGGTGLGLAIVKHIVQLHGGSISAESRPGEGSVFTIRLPR